MDATKLHAVADPEGSGEWSIGLTSEPMNERFDLRATIADGGRCVLHFGRTETATMITTAYSASVRSSTRSVGVAAGGGDERRARFSLRGTTGSSPWTATNPMD